MRVFSSKRLSYAKSFFVLFPLLLPGAKPHMPCGQRMAMIIVFIFVGCRFKMRHFFSHLRLCVGREKKIVVCTFTFQILIRNLTFYCTIDRETYSNTFCAYSFTSEHKIGMFLFIFAFFFYTAFYTLFYLLDAKYTHISNRTIIECVLTFSAVIISKNKLNNLYRIIREMNHRIQNRNVDSIIFAITLENMLQTSSGRPFPRPCMAQVFRFALENVVSP